VDRTTTIVRRVSSLPNWVFVLAALVAAIAVPLLNQVGLVDTAWVRVGIRSMTYVLLALGLNLVMGETGLLNLGYVAFFAVGAYTTALLSSGKFGLQYPFWLLIVLSMLLAMIAGLMVGLPTLRLRGDYLAIVTLAFGEIVRLTAQNMQSVTNGPNGITGIYPPRLVTEGLSERLVSSGAPNWLTDILVINEPIEYYFMVLIFVILTIVLLNNIKKSRIGRAWNALREDELAASSMGINASKLKLLSVVFSAGIGGLAGSLYAYYSTFINPTSFLFMQSVIVVCMVVLGGMGSIPGVVLGAIVLDALPQAIREISSILDTDFETYRMLVFGIIIVLMVMFRPEGLVPNALWRREAHEEDPHELERTRQRLFDLEEGHQDLEV